MSSYNKTFWSDNESPSLDAAHLNKIENGIEGVTDEVEDARGNYQNLKQRLDNITTPTDEQVEEAVADYLDEHPAVEGTINKKSSISAQSQTGDSDTNYPTVGAVRDYVEYAKGDLEDYIDDELNALDSAKADKSNTYTKSEIDAMIGNIETLLSQI